MNITDVLFHLAVFDNLGISRR